MFLRIRNWKLALLALLFFCLFISLGRWQLHRAEEKEALMQAMAERTKLSPLAAKNLNVNERDLRFFRIQLQGEFDTAHSFLLDNKTYHGQVGYELYTPFKAKGLNKFILIDRGFIPLGASRDILPSVKTPTETVTILGMLNQPPTYQALGAMQETTKTSWPLRIEYIQLDKMAALLNTSFSSYILTLAPNNPAAYPLEWQAVNMDPQRHRGYALQWFAFALTLLILFAALNRGEKKS
jgi:surfeit locus 1 family protein